MNYDDATDRDPRSIVQETLFSRKIEVEKELEEMRAYHRENKESLFGEGNMEDVDRAGREISAQTYYSLLERKTQELEKIENIIKHISEDELFGICEDCGEEIGIERILAIPDVTRCIDCQRDYEKDWARENNRMKFFFLKDRKDDLDMNDGNDDYKASAVEQRIDYHYLSNDDLDEIPLDGNETDRPDKQGPFS